ncbi:MAG: dihydrofolate reductase, partial [Candidatus Yanofskybacteria bacterium]|nr:dihydrofolate reductase [Candidatus Yanofskybacteria bacterium]
ESEQVFILGGGEVYIAALPLAHNIFLTLIHQAFEGDTKFPSIFLHPAWKEVEHEDHEPDEKNKFPYSFITLRRR